jgi:hypothetical protein
MTRLVRTLSIAACLSALAVAAQAQATRTFVSGVGNDVDPCSRTAPCRTFAGALIKTQRGGEISVLDPGGYGTVNITKSITISGDGTLGSTLFSGTSGIIVNITDAADTFKRVVIRNVSFQGGASTVPPNGQPTGVNAIRFLAGNQLQVQNVNINGCTTRGIDVAMGAGAAGIVYVQDTTISNCPTGIRATATSGFAEVILDNVKIEGYTNGVELAANGRLIARNSLFGGTGLNQNGVLVNASTAQASLDRCTIAFNNVAGVNVAVSGGVARVGSSAFYSNSTGITNVVGGVTQSDGRNYFGGNTANGAFTGPAMVVQ